MINKLFLFKLTVILYLGFSSAGAAAQVNIAPVAIYMDDDQTTGRIVVRNSSNKPQELSIDLIFGYPGTNEQGEVVMKTFDKVPVDAPSAGKWVRVYPRHLVLPPQQQQTIRFSARPPAGLPAGEYWIRPTVSTRNVVDIGNGAGDNISASINLIKRTILSLNYRRGKVQTGIQINEVTGKTAGNQLQLLAKLERKGNAAYLGDSQIQIFDASGELQHRKKKEIAVYHSQKRKFEVDISGLSPGEYRAEISFDTRERAAKNDAVLPAPLASHTVKFLVEGS